MVGTALITEPEQWECKKGRIVVFQLVDGRLQQITEIDTKGAPYVLREFNGKLLAAINSSMRLFDMNSMHELYNESSFFVSTLSLLLKTKGDFVVVGDLTRSISVAKYSPIGGTFEVLGCDGEATWLSALEIIDDDTYIGADNSYNLFVVQKDV